MINLLRIKDWKNSFPGVKNFFVQSVTRNSFLQHEYKQKKRLNDQIYLRVLLTLTAFFMPTKIPHRSEGL